MEEENNCIIYIQTKQGYVFKALAEFFHFAFTNVILHVSKAGIKARIDNRKKTEKASILSDLTLDAKKFLIYTVPEALEEDEEAELHLCFEARLLRAAASGIRKKDRLTLYVTKDEPMKLRVAINNADKEKSSILGIPLIPFEKMPATDKDPEGTCDYSREMPNATCVASELQKACKGGGQSKSAKIQITAQDRGVRFEVQDSIDKEYFFGRWERGYEELYCKTFVAKGVVDTIARCCGMATTGEIYCEGVKPVCFTLNCGNLGSLSIYLVHTKI